MCAVAGEEWSGGGWGWGWGGRGGEWAADEPLRVEVGWLEVRPSHLAQLEFVGDSQLVLGHVGQD